MIDVEPIITESLERLYPVPDPVEGWARVLTDADRTKTSRTATRRVPRPRVLIVALAVAVLCGGGSAAAVTLSGYFNHHSRWQALLNDYLDDARIEGDYSCRDAQDALSKVKAFDAGGTTDPRVGVRIPVQPFARYARTTCR